MDHLKKERNKTFLHPPLVLWNKSEISDVSLFIRTNIRLDLKTHKKGVVASKILESLVVRT